MHLSKLGYSLAPSFSLVKRKYCYTTGESGWLGKSDLHLNVSALLLVCVPISRLLEVVLVAESAEWKAAWLLCLRGPCEKSI